MEEFLPNWVDLIRLTKSIVSKKFHSMEYSVTWCGQTQWTMKLPFMGISQRIRNVTAQSTLERNLSNLYSRKISYWVYSEVTKWSKMASTCTNGAAETLFPMLSRFSLPQITAAHTRIKPPFWSWKTIICSSSSTRTPSHHINCLKDLIFSVGHCHSSLRRLSLCSTRSSSSAHPLNWRKAPKPKKLRPRSLVKWPKPNKSLSERWFWRTKFRRLEKWTRCSQLWELTKKFFSN